MNKIFINESKFPFDLDQVRVEEWVNNIRNKLIQLSKNNINCIYDSERGRIQSALYAFEDSQSVIEDYKNLKNFKATDSGYLKLYGIFQALFVQQDSLKNLRIAINNSQTNFYEDYKGLYSVRNIRNMTIDHPTDERGEYFLISQMSINKYGYQMIGYLKSGKTTTININIYKLLTIQENGVVKIMNLINSEINN